MALVVKNPSVNAADMRDSVLFLGQEDPLEEGMAIHSCILTWRILWTEEPGRLQSIGSQRVGHDWSDISTHTPAKGDRKATWVLCRQGMCWGWWNVS